jgi:hypothetical protein
MSGDLALSWQEKKIEVLIQEEMEPLLVGGLEHYHLVI